MGEIPIDQARLLESNIIPQTPDPKSHEVNSPRVIQAADSTQSRQIPLIIIDGEEIQPPAIEVIELEWVHIEDAQNQQCINCYSFMKCDLLLAKIGHNPIFPLSYENDSAINSENLTRIPWNHL